jgi:hypothetical protein
MKKLVLLPLPLLALAAYALFQTTEPAPPLAGFMPSGALLYLESPDFGRLLRDWDSSRVKSEWLESANYAVFSRSNLFTKLSEVYGQYGEAAGFLPDLKGAIGIAGTESALALYGIRDVQFLYVSRIAESDLAKSALWGVRSQFEQRQAGGISFYLRSDPASKRTVAFAFARGCLILATRDDLMAQSLELLAGAQNPSVASDRWYRDAVAQASERGELRLVMNLESVVRSDYFRSYWIQRNASVVRRYWTGISDVKRSAGSIDEHRVFLRLPETTANAGSPAVSNLVRLVPPEAGMYKSSRLADASAAATLMIDKLIGAPPERVLDWRTAPLAVSPDNRAGSETDLETRIDEQPLPPDAGISDSVAAVRGWIEKSQPAAILLVQSSSSDAAPFIRTPTVIVLEGSSDWDAAAVRSVWANAAAKLWTTKQLGVAWVPAIAGRQAIERLDGLGSLAFALRGRLLFLGNDTQLMASTLDRTGESSSTASLTYAAGFRHLHERANYERLMAALDFSSPAPEMGLYRAGGPDRPSFFSGNIASLSRVLSGLGDVGVTEEEKGPATIQRVSYHSAQ